MEHRGGVSVALLMYVCARILCSLGCQWAMLALLRLRYPVFEWLVEREILVPAIVARARCVVSHCLFDTYGDGPVRIFHGRDMELGIDYYTIHASFGGRRATIGFDTYLADILLSQRRKRCGVVFKYWSKPIAFA